MKDLGVLTQIKNKYGNMTPALKAGLWFTICNFLQKGVSFVTIPIFTRIMTTDEYGAYSVYTSWYNLLTIFLTLNLSYYVFSKGMVKFENDKDVFVVSLQSLNTSITVVAIIAYSIFSSKINSLLDLTTPLMVCMLLQILIEPSIAYWTARKRFEYDYKSVIKITLGITIFNPILGIILICCKIPSDAVLGRSISVTLVALVVGVTLCVQAIKKARTGFSTKYWKYALLFNIPLIPHFLSQTILNQADRIMIKDMCGSTDAAIYSVAYSVGMAVTLFSQAIQQSFLPWLYKKIKASDFHSVSAISSVLLASMAVINLLIIAFAPEIILIVGGSAYEGAIWVLPSICGSVFFIFLQNLFANIEYYFEKTKLIAAASVLVALLNVGLNYVFIKAYGYIAAGYTTLFCYVAYAVFHYIVMVCICNKAKLNVRNFFNKKLVMALSVLFLCALFIISLLYSIAIARYCFIALLIVLPMVFRRKLYNVFKEIKSDKGIDER